MQVGDLVRYRKEYQERMKDWVGIIVERADHSAWDAGFHVQWGNGIREWRLLAELEVV